MAAETVSFFCRCSSIRVKSGAQVLAKCARTFLEHLFSEPEIESSKLQNLICSLLLLLSLWTRPRYFTAVTVAVSTVLLLSLPAAFCLFMLLFISALLFCCYCCCSFFNSILCCTCSLEGNQMQDLENELELQQQQIKDLRSQLEKERKIREMLVIRLSDEQRAR